jgi:hypothetical protein
MVALSLTEPDRAVLPLEDHRHAVVQFRHLGVRREPVIALCLPPDRI